MCGFIACWKYYFILSISEAVVIILDLGFSQRIKYSPPKSKWDRGKNVDIFGVELAKNVVTLPLNLATPGLGAHGCAWLPSRAPYVISFLLPSVGFRVIKNLVFFIINLLHFLSGKYFHKFSLIFK